MLDKHKYWNISMGEQARYPEYLAAKKLRESFEAAGVDATVTDKLRSSERNHIVLGTLKTNKTLAEMIKDTVSDKKLSLLSDSDGFILQNIASAEGRLTIVLIGGTPRGVMYGGYKLARRIKKQGIDFLKDVDLIDKPSLAIRSLSTDFGSEEHWRRIFEGIPYLGINRLVYWFDSSGSSGHGNLCVYKKYPRLRKALDLTSVKRARERFHRICELAMLYEIDLWYTFHVIHFDSGSSRDKNILRACYPEFFTRSGEPDMSNPQVYQFIQDQIEEILKDFPTLTGVALWSCECSTWPPGFLTHQDLRADEIFEKLVSGVRKICKEHNKHLLVDLHSPGGQRKTVNSILGTVSKFHDITVQSDCTWSDWSLHLPTSPFLKKISNTNKTFMSFDCYGEYFGRNGVPTCTPYWIEKHFREGVKIGIVGANGRIATGHDVAWPHTNVIPRENEEKNFGTPCNEERRNLELSCFDTLSGLNMSVLAALMWNPDADPNEIMEVWIEETFGERGKSYLTSAFGKVENISSKVFFTNTLYTVFQSVLRPTFDQFKLSGFLSLFEPPGTPFPGDEVREQSWFSFEGWPTSEGLKTVSVSEMRKEKEEAIRLCESAIRDIKQAKEHISHDAYGFLINQFEGLLEVSRVFRMLIDVLYQVYLCRKDPAKERFRKELDTLLQTWGQYSLEIKERRGRDFFFELPGSMLGLVSSIQEHFIPSSWQHFRI